MKKKRVLLVEDDHSINFALSLCLEMNECEVDSAFTYIEARDKLSNSAYDVVISDVQLPGGCGVELMSDLHKDLKFKNTRKIMLSAFPKQSVLEMAPGNVFDLILTKPSSFSDILAAIS